jgi:hypothetical protein
VYRSSVEERFMKVCRETVKEIPGQCYYEVYRDSLGPDVRNLVRTMSRGGR